MYLVRTYNIYVLNIVIVIDAIKQRWKHKKWFKITVIIAVLFIAGGILLQGVIGLNPLSGGETVLGNQNAEYDLAANETVIYQANLTTELNSIAFTANNPVRFYLLKEPVNSSVSTEFYTNNSIELGTTEEFSIWIEETTPVSLILVAPEDQDIRYRFEIRSFDSEDRTRLNLYYIGGFLYTGALITIIIYLVIGEFIPWLLYRGESNQTQ